jgi:hypothetical protein
MPGVKKEQSAFLSPHLHPGPVWPGRDGNTPQLPQTILFVDNTKQIGTGEIIIPAREWRWWKENFSWGDAEVLDYAVPGRHAPGTA